MIKTLDVTLMFSQRESNSLPRKMNFLMEVPVEVFCLGGEFILRAAPESSKVDLYMVAVTFRPRSDGTVEVRGFSKNYNLDDALPFLAAHPDISDVREL